MGLSFDPEKFSGAWFFQTASLLEGEIKRDHGISGTEVFLLVDLEEMIKDSCMKGFAKVLCFLLSHFSEWAILRRKYEDACHIFPYLTNKKLDKESGSLYNKYACISTSLSDLILKHSGSFN